MKQTVLVTGGAGYIGSWVVKNLLEKGYTVRVTVRNKSNTEKYQHLLDMGNENPGSVELWEADLLKANSFNEAAKGCDSIIHIASPFKLKVKDAQKDLVDPAVNGTQYVLEAANQSGTVKKVVLTSSVASVHGDTIDMQEQGLKEFTEEHFNTTSSVSHQPYSFSKVQAEKKAWEIAKAQNNWELIVINPSFVMGPSIADSSDSESITLVKDLIKGKFKMGIPALYFGFVDVRDVARAHVIALEKDEVEGRHILAERVMTFLDLAKIIHLKFGDQYKKLPTKESPKWLMILMGWMFGVTAKFIKRNVGYPILLNTTKSKEKLGLNYTSIDKTVEDMVLQMQKLKIV